VAERELTGVSPEAAAFLRRTPAAGPGLPPWGPLVRLRRRLRARMARPGLDALRRQFVDGVQHRHAGGLEVVEITPRSAHAPNGERALFLHSGGYTGGAALDATAILMADALRLPVLSLEYPLAPEARYPVALDRCVAAYRALAGERRGAFVLFGESAGAGLALALLHRARAAGLPMPAAVGLFTPWCDRAAAAYAGRADPAGPELSPIHARYDPGFPPCLITTGTRDLFLSLCVRLYWTLRRAGAAAELRVWEGMWHSFNAQEAMPEARECRAEMADFLRRHLRPALAGPQDVVAILAPPDPPGTP
jgi:epsilon-lactone hydrolase